MSTEENRRLSDLRVVDLKAELEKRGLDRNGNKQALLDRLHKALVDEGKLPDSYQFDLDSAKKAQTKGLSISNTNQGENSVNSEEKLGKEGNGQVNPDTMAEETAKQDETKAAETKEEVKNVAETATNGEGGKEGDPKNDTIQLTLDEGESLAENDADPNADKTEAKEDDKTKNAEGEKSKESTGDDNKGPEQDGKTEEKSATGSPSSKPVRGPSDANNRNLWITNISQTTRATELKQALSEHGKVIGAKVVINARYPGACCYGYVKMETVADADNCIAKLNNTELNGQIIKIEKVRPDHLNPLKAMNKKGEDSKDKHNRRSTNKPGPKEGDKKDKKIDGKKDEGEKKEGDDKDAIDTDRNRDKNRKSGSRPRHDRSLSSRSRRDRERELLTFDKIKRERERERLHERERMIREEKRRREDIERQREIERRQRSESRRLEREREKLRAERDRLERERAALMARERKRQDEEREKLEMEKIELERAKIRMQEEERRTVKRPAPYRRDEPYDEKRRAPNDRHFDEAPPPPRFDGPNRSGDRRPTLNAKRPGILEKRDNYPSKRDRDFEDRPHPPPPMVRPPPPNLPKYEGSTSLGFNPDREMPPRPRDSQPQMTNSKYPLVSKDNRYNDRERERERASPHFRGGIRDDRDRRPMPDHKPDIRNNREHRYGGDMGKDSRNFDRGNGNWHPAPEKNFNAGSAGPTAKNWGKDNWRPGGNPSNERWNSGNSRAGMSGPFSNSNMNLGPSCPPPPGINNYVNDRFDYKNMGNMRKY